MNLDNLIPLPFYQRLNPRERVLVLLVAGTAFLLGNLLAVSTLIRSYHSLRRDYAEKSDQWEFSRHFIQDKAVWDARAEWLRKTQPKLTNRDSASYELIEQVQGLGRQYKVIITNLRPVATATGAGGEKRSGEYQPVTMAFDTRSDWGTLVNFLEGVQKKPEGYLAFDEARFHSEPNDPQTLIGNFGLSKWYAANGN